MVTRPVTLKVDGLKIAGRIYLPAEGDKQLYPTVCICHGIPSGNPPAPGDKGYPGMAENICSEVFGVFIFNFRGTGFSEGNLDILGWTRDLKAAIDYLYALPEVDRTHLSLLGFSGGAAVSVYVASQDTRVTSVVACACPAEFSIITRADSLPSVIDRYRSIGVFRDKSFPHSVEEWFNGFRAVSPIKCVAGIAPDPLLIVHGNQDETVPLDNAYRLYEKAKEPKQITIVDGAGHRLRWDGSAMAAVINWLKSQCQN
ncbi:alpha/beta hydrolase [Chloroflexota bacterium]